MKFLIGCLVALVGLLFSLNAAASLSRVPCFATTSFNLATDSPTNDQKQEANYKVTLYKYDNYHILYACKPGPQPCAITLSDKNTQKNNTIRAGGYISSLYKLVKYFKVEDPKGTLVCEIKATLELNKEGECTLQYDVIKNPEKCACETTKEKGPGNDQGKPELDLMGNCKIKI